MTLVHILPGTQQNVAVSSVKEKQSPKALEKVFKQQVIPSVFPETSVSPLSMAQGAALSSASQTVAQVSYYGFKRFQCKWLFWCLYLF